MSLWTVLWTAGPQWTDQVVGVSGGDLVRLVLAREVHWSPVSPAWDCVPAATGCPWVRRPALPASAAQRSRRGRRWWRRSWQEGQSIDVPGTYDGEMSKIKSGNFLDCESFGQGDHGRIGGPQR